MANSIAGTKNKSGGGVRVGGVSVFFTLRGAFGIQLIRSLLFLIVILTFIPSRSQSLITVSARIAPRERAYPIILQDGLGFSGILDEAYRTPYSVPAAAIGAPVLHNSWPNGLAPLGTYRFHGGVFDGSSIWLVPYDSSQVIRMFTVNKTMFAYDKWPQNGFVKSSAAFSSGNFDGSSIWLIPYNADRVVRLFIANGSMVGYNGWPTQDGFVKQTAAFTGSVYDGSSIWMVPYNADRVVRLFCANGTMVGYKNWPQGMTVGSRAFSGGLFDGMAVWLAPQEADRFVRISLNGNMTGHFFPPPGTPLSPPSISAVLTTPAHKNGLLFTIGKSRIWQVPFYANSVQSWSLSNLSSSGEVFPTWPQGFTKLSKAFAGGTFDGCSVWFAPSGTGTAVRIFTGNGSMQAYPLWPSGYPVPTIAAFRGAVFDGTSVWFIPCESSAVVQIPASTCPGYYSTETSTLSPTLIVADVATRTMTPSDTPLLSQTQTTLLKPERNRTRTTTLTGTVDSAIVEEKNTTRSWSSKQCRMQNLNENTRTQTATVVVAPPPIVKRPNAVATVLGSQATAQAVATSSVSTALVAGSISPTMASQAGRTFALLRVATCKFNNDTEDDPEYLELPLQMTLGGGGARGRGVATDASYPRYAGSLVFTLAALYLLPALLMTLLHLLLYRFPDSRVLHFIQRKIVSTLFFLAVGYFLPTAWKVFLLVVTNDSDAPSIITVTIALIISLVTYAGLLRISLKPPSLALFLAPDQENWRRSDRTEVDKAQRSENDESARNTSILLSTFGPLFTGTRNATLLVRLYFIEDLLVSSVLQALNGIRTGDSLYCRGIATAMTCIMFLHIGYLAVVRPYREVAELILTLAGSVILLAIGITACLIMFSNESSAQMNLFLTAVGYLGLAESVYFYVQLCVVAVLEVTRAHRRRLQQHWLQVESPLDQEESHHNPSATTPSSSIEVPLLDLVPTAVAGTPIHAESGAFPGVSQSRRGSAALSNPLLKNQNEFQ